MQNYTNFLILTPAFNCQSKIDRTIRSVAMQTYEHWNMIIVDDVSTDQTVESIAASCSKYGLELGNKVKIISRTEKFGEVRNTLDVCLELPDDVVVIRLDAGDWITDMGALQIIDLIYRQYDPAVLWTNQRWSWSSYSICGQINPEVSVYEQPWVSSHMKTFRSKELKNIDERNFKDDDGNWITIACDQAIFLPMLERARRNKRNLMYLPLVMYHYDIDLNNPTLFKEDRSVKQKMSAERIRQRGFIE